jgi:hypothetical protein
LLEVELNKVRSDLNRSWVENYSVKIEYTFTRC